MLEEILALLLPEAVVTDPIPWSIDAVVNAPLIFQFSITIPPVTVTPFGLKVQERAPTFTFAVSVLFARFVSPAVGEVITAVLIVDPVVKPLISVA